MSTRTATAPGGQWLSLIGSTEGPPRDAGRRRLLSLAADSDTSGMTEGTTGMTDGTTGLTDGGMGMTTGATAGTTTGP